jgi:hypothetical protein
MATSRDDMQDQKLTFRKFKEGDTDWNGWSNKIFKEDTSYKCPTYVNRTPPCQGSCPSGEDIRGWLDIVPVLKNLLQIQACKNTHSVAQQRRILSLL